jgi:SAM-dependent MidA family methyltransferase
MNPLAQQIAAEIAARGPMPFGKFMSRALYDSVHGYYNRSLQQIGKRGDFYTSVSVGPLFGELLATQFAQWLQALPKTTNSFQCVEAGAHDGTLAFDILKALQSSQPALFTNLQYWIIEPSPARRAAQQRKLEGFSNVRWFGFFSEMPDRIHGVIFSNELLDAMPVSVFRWNATEQKWNEMGVSIRDENFIWMELPEPWAAEPELPAELLSVLPDRHIVEASSDARNWWMEAGSVLAQGKLMAIDYGGMLEEILSPSRTTGTLRAYSAHQVTGDVLKDPGEQDITAHVNFSEIQELGEASGLKTEMFTTQSDFLTRIARDSFHTPEAWTSQRVRQFQTLTHPEHLGRPFRVLVQSREAERTQN